MKDNQLNHNRELKLLYELSQSNIRHGRIFAIIIIAIESILLLVDLCSRSIKTSFNFNLYALMYIAMIVATVCLFVFLNHAEKKLAINCPRVKSINLVNIIYLSFFMTWGAFISLLDQNLYGNIAAFLANLLLGSLMFNMKSTYILIPQSIACFFFMVGLPQFQPSRDILIGHYVNICIFLIFSQIMARANYNNFVKNFTNQQLIEEKSNLLTQTNNNLILEIHSRELAQVELELANAQLTAISSLDALTEIPNRRKLDEYLMQLWTAALKEQLPVSIMMIDIDYFKSYNDTQGHLAGDSCLRSVAKVINDCIRKGRDFVARYGGEEFLFVSKGTNREEAWLLGEKIRENVAALGLSHTSSPISDCVTVSVGISCSIPANTDSIIQCIDKADQAMYQAKQGGRNRVIIAD